MTHLDLNDRIRKLDVSTILKMSPDALSMLTDKFNESLVKAVIYRGKTNTQQRNLIAYLKKAYKSWMEENDPVYSAFPRYPDFLQEMQFNIECDYILTAEGLAEEEKARLEVYPVTTLVQSYNKVLKNKNIKIEQKVTNKEMEDAQKRIKELEAEVEQLKKNTSITQEEFNTIFDNNTGNQENSEFKDDNSQIGALVEVTDSEFGDTKKQLELARQRIKELESQVEELQQKLVESANVQVWIDWLDNDVFMSTVNAEKIYDILCKTSTVHLSDRPRCYVLFRVLSVIGGLKKNASQKDILKWWNAHFKCGWHGDNQFKFTDLPDSIKKQRDIFQWKDCKGRNAEHYHAFAQDLLKELVWNKGRGEYEIKTKFLKK